LRAHAQVALELTGLALARLLAALLGFLVTTLLARALGPADYGRLAMLLALQGQALLFAEWGLRSVVTADCGSNPADVRRSLAGYFGLRLALAGAVATIGLTIADRLVPGSAVSALVLLSALFASALLCDWVALARGHAVEASLPLLLRPGVSALALSALTACGMPISLEGAAVWLTAGWWVAALVSLAALRHLPKTKGAHTTAVTTLLCRAVPLGLAGVAAQALLAVDILLIGLCFGAAQAGHYQIAAGVLTAGLIFANAASQLGLARAGRLRDRRGEHKQVVLSGLTAVVGLGLSLAAVAACLGPLVLPRLFGEAYRPAADMLLWLLPWFTLQHASAWLQGVLAALARERAVLGANLAALAVALSLFGLAGWLGDPHIMAVGRGAAEAVRTLLLFRAVTFRTPRLTDPTQAAPVMRAATGT
jgi:O-antigen/teichoic acid export membrane protein